MLLLAALSLAAPPLDPESGTEYRWRVGVRFDQPAAFAPDFRARICRELLAAVGQTVGDCGRCQVVDLRAVPEADRTPLEKRFLLAGLAAADGDEARTLTGVKQHLVRVSLTGTAFTAEARQVDGTAGLATPAVRSRTTRDPQSVGREVGLLVTREFGPVGTVERDPKLPDRATVRFKGGGLPGFDGLAKAGDVFAVGYILEKPRPVERDKRGRPVPPKTAGPAVLECQPRSNVLLRLEADPQNGAARCRVLSRFADPLPAVRGAVGVRCLKLLTVDAPVAVRLVGPDGKPPAVGGGLLSVRATDTGFDAPSDPRDGLELRDGVYRSNRPLRGLACVTVALAGRPAEPFVVPLTGPGPVTLPFGVDPGAAALAGFLRECDDLRGRVAEAAVAFDQLRTALFDLITKGQTAPALLRAARGLEQQEADDKALTADLGRLRADPLAADPAAAALLQSAERQLARTRADRPEIQGKLDELKGLAARAADPAVIEKEFRRTELVARIRQRVEAGDVPEALELYDQLLEVQNTPEVKALKAKLAADWEPKDPAHRRAREWVADTWVKLPAVAADIRPATDDLPRVVGVLTAKEDRLGLRQVLASFEPLYVKLKGVADKLDPQGEADKKKRDELKELAADLRKREDEVRAAVQKIEGPK